MSNNSKTRVHTSIVKPFLYGNKARFFGKTREDGFTHEWTVYVKPYFNEDMSKYVKKVHFKLHDSYTNSVRVITEPPYQVAECGWGEFDVHIRIYFVEPNEKAISFTHHLTLFAPGQQRVFTEGLHKYEYYDELIFNDPQINFHKILVEMPCDPIPSKVKKYNEKSEICQNKLMKARQIVLKEIEQLSSKFETLKQEISQNRNIINDTKSSLMVAENLQNTKKIIVKEKETDNVAL